MGRSGDRCFNTCNNMLRNAERFSGLVKCFDFNRFSKEWYVK